MVRNRVCRTYRFCAAMEVLVFKLPSELSPEYPPLDLWDVSPVNDVIKYDITTHGGSPLEFGQAYQIVVQISNIFNSVKAVGNKAALCPGTVTCHVGPGHALRVSSDRMCGTVRSRQELRVEPQSRQRDIR